MIPKEFEQRMQALLQDEYPSYIEEMNKEARRGFRINTLKIDVDSFFEISNFQKEQTPFSKESYYLIDEAGVGKSPLHTSGLMYIQEPSASSVVPLLDVKPGMKVLDLCAAPGSKSTNIASLLQNEGLLVSNEIHPKRAKILKENTIRWGSANTLVINSDPTTIAKAFENYFDAVLVDAPCSGEGMFRKNDKAMDEWSIENVEACARRQKGILEDAYTCLKPGGTLVYSTCTFALEENELQMVDFLQSHSDMHIVQIDNAFGRAGYDYGYDTVLSRRIFPMDGGEGHYLCKLVKDEVEFVSNELDLLKSDKIPDVVYDFIKENLTKELPYLYCHKGHVYGGVHPFIKPGKCKVVNHQVYLGEVVKNRFEPSFDVSINSFVSFKKQLEVSYEQAIRYLKGETLPCVNEKGYYAVTYKNHPIGFGKCDGRILKNKYPKEYRIKN